jgi:hypothetical protein
VLAIMGLCAVLRPPHGRSLRTVASTISDMLFYVHVRAGADSPKE